MAIIIRKMVSTGVVLLILGVVSTSWGITITEPKSGTVYHPGDKVNVRAVADTGEIFIGVFLYSLKSYASVIDNLPPYELEYTIDPKFTGEDIIVASGKYPNGNTVEAEVKILVTLPSSVTVTGIRVRDDQKYLFMSRIPEDEKIRVYGQYSDGVERDVSSSAAGTTYTSSDEKIATVDANGLVTAVAPGTARITIKNGKNEITVRVDVKPKR